MPKKPWYVANSVDGFLKMFDAVTNVINLLPEVYIEDLCRQEAVLIIYMTQDVRVVVYAEEVEEEVRNLTFEWWSSREVNAPYFPQWDKEVPHVSAWEAERDIDEPNPPLVLWETWGEEESVVKVLDMRVFEEERERFQEENPPQTNVQHVAQTIGSDIHGLNYANVQHVAGAFARLSERIRGNDHYYDLPNTGGVQLALIGNYLRWQLQQEADRIRAQAALDWVRHMTVEDEDGYDDAVMNDHLNRIERFLTPPPLDNN